MKRRTFLATAAGASTALALGATGTAGADTDALLRRWFRDTYRSIEALTTGFGLTADTMDVTASRLTPSVNTSPTNIGCGLWATVAAAWARGHRRHDDAPPPRPHGRRRRTA